MANINQGAPGFVAQGDEGVTLIHEEHMIVDGDRRSVEVFSDGSRKHYVNGKLTDDVKVFSDQEKAEGLAPESAAPVAPEIGSGLTAAGRSEIEALHGPDTFPNNVLTDAEAEAAALLAEAQAIAEIAAEKGEAAALEAKAAAEAELAHLEELAAKVEAQAKAEAEAEFADLEPKAETLVEKVEDIVEEVKSEVEDLTFKTVAELKDLAGKLGIDLGKATKKDDIIAAIQPPAEEPTPEA